MPLYVDRKSTVSIYSVDNGDTWHRMTSQPYAENTDEWQMVEAPDGSIVGFGRQKRFGKTLCPFLSTRKKLEQMRQNRAVRPKCQKA